MRSENKQSAPKSWPYPSTMRVLGITLRLGGQHLYYWTTSSVTQLVSFSHVPTGLLKGQSKAPMDERSVPVTSTAGTVAAR